MIQTYLVVKGDKNVVLADPMPVVPMIGHQMEIPKRLREAKHFPFKSGEVMRIDAIRWILTGNEWVILIVLVPNDLVVVTTPLTK